MSRFVVSRKVRQKLSENAKTTPWGKFAAKSGPKAKSETFSQDSPYMAADPGSLDFQIPAGEQAARENDY